MSEELVEEILSTEAQVEAHDEAQVDTPEVTEDPDYSQEELEKAVANGYDPDDEKGLSPGEFNRNGSFFKKIKALKAEKTREVNELRRQLNDLKSQVTDAQRRGFEDGLKAVEAQRLEAVKYGNTEEFEKLDARANELRAQMNNVPTAIDPVLMEFQERNKDWVNGDTPAGRVIYDKVMDFSKALAPALSPYEKIQQIEEYVKLAFPERGKPKEPVPKPVSAVAPSNSPAIKSKSDSYKLSDLDEMQRQSYERILRNNPKFSVDDYVALLQRGIK